MTTEMESIPFEGIIQELNFFVFHAGIDALKREGIIRQDAELQDATKNSPSHLRWFIRASHYGFNVAQNKIGRLVIDYEVLIRDLTGSPLAAFVMQFHRDDWGRRST
jgi:hypothetical protein